jgi:hypothetical protein
LLTKDDAKAAVTAATAAEDHPEVYFHHPAFFPCLVHGVSCTAM